MSEFNKENVFFSTNKYIEHQESMQKLKYIKLVISLLVPSSHMESVLTEATKASLAGAVVGATLAAIVVFAAAVVVYTRKRHSRRTWQYIRIDNPKS